ncbi:hypothetical protein GCM10022198_12860 [Klugiella xanthotipulae]|uniref:Uncharacterized protein n=1 Tax=Klugiella xanthotipulae TaxID=244735 RepID=A0A543I454_9MICO|nr:hypothetical protein [Klugiella xanthotipulae]TQM65373.1 hypothetical protein FB466_0173 [Klugiella xanthotipulae]
MTPLAIASSGIVVFLVLLGALILRQIIRTRRSSAGADDQLWERLRLTGTRTEAEILSGAPRLTGPLPAPSGLPPVTVELKVRFSDRLGTPYTAWIRTSVAADQLGAVETGRQISVVFDPMTPRTVTHDRNDSQLQGARSGSVASPVTGYTSATTATATANSRPTSRTPGRGLGWLIIGAAVGLPILVSVAGSTNWAGFLPGGETAETAHATARETAQNYIEAVAAGDATEANALAHLSTADPQHRLLTDKVLGAASPITEVQLGEDGWGTDLDSAENSALYQVGYTLDGEDSLDFIELEKNSAGEWVVTEGLVSDSDLSADLYGARFALPGDSSDAGENFDTAATSSANAFLYLGVYTLKTPNSFFTVSGDSTVALGSSGLRITDTQLTPSPAFVAEAQKQINAQIDECALSKDFYEFSLCGLHFGYPESGMLNAPTTVTTTVTITEYPTLTLPDTAFGDATLTNGNITATVSDGTVTETLMAAFDAPNPRVTIVDGKVIVTLR